MNSLFVIFAQVAETAPAAGGRAGTGAFLFQIAAIFAIFYFIMIRPQQKQRKAHEASILALKKGDNIVTAGGIVAEVIHIKEGSTKSLSDHVTIKSGESRIVITRGRIAAITPDGTAAS